MMVSPVSGNRSSTSRRSRRRNRPYLFSGRKSLPRGVPGLHVHRNDLPVRIMLLRRFDVALDLVRVLIGFHHVNAVNLCFNVERGDCGDVGLANPRGEKSSQHGRAEPVETGVRFAIRRLSPREAIGKGRILSELLGGVVEQVGSVLVHSFLLSYTF